MHEVLIGRSKLRVLYSHSIMIPSTHRFQDKRSRGYLFRTRKSVGLGGQQVRNRKGGYLFRTRRDPGTDSGMGKRAEYLFRTRRTPYVAAGKRQGSYLFRTREVRNAVLNQDEKCDTSGR